MIRTALFRGRRGAKSLDHLIVPKSDRVSQTEKKVPIAAPNDSIGLRIVLAYTIEAFALASLAYAHHYVDFPKYCDRNDPNNNGK